MSLNWVCHDLVDILGQVRESVGVTVGEVNGVVLVLIVISERVGEVAAEDSVRWLLVILTDTILVVADFCSPTMPADVSMRSHLLRVDQDFHALVIETVRLAEVQHVEAHLDWLVVRCPEEVPLGVPTSVHIVLQQAVVLVVIYPSCCSQVPRLKATLKNESVIIWVLARVEWLDVHLDELFLLWVVIVLIL